MADEDEIDILGEFSFNSCLAQNNQGIPSCSDREDTVHPEWLLDSTANNWYDSENKSRSRLKSFSSVRKANNNRSGEPVWTALERRLLASEMKKYGRNVKKISQVLKTKTEAQIQAIIEAEHGINLDTPVLGFDRTQDDDEIPTAIQEEIVTDDPAPQNVLQLVSTGVPTVPIPKAKSRRNAKNSLLRPEVLLDLKKTNDVTLNSEIFYEDDMTVGSTESIGADVDLADISKQLLLKQNDRKLKTSRKIGNHRRKYTRSTNKGSPTARSKDSIRSPQSRQIKYSGLSDDSAKSTQLQIVLGSGQALPLSEGEQVIKIEKKNDSDPESDIDVDVDSDAGTDAAETRPGRQSPPPGGDLPGSDPTSSDPVGSDPVGSDPAGSESEEPIAVPLLKYERMPRRQRKINLDGEGGYTISHTAAGDVLAPPPRRARPAPRPARAAPPELVQCRVYNAERPPPFAVHMCVSTLLAMDAHAHSSRSEVTGLMGGEGGAAGGGRVTLSAYRPVAAAASATHCDMDPVSQAAASESLLSAGYAVLGWHHSHPRFPPAPSRQDLSTQRACQRAARAAPFLGFITSQNWPTGRTASQYRCFRVEDPLSPAEPAGYQLRVRLVPDLSVEALDDAVAELAALLRGGGPGGGRPGVAGVTGGAGDWLGGAVAAVCPQAGVTYLEKFISSARHHLRAAGYADDDLVPRELTRRLRGAMT